MPMFLLFLAFACLAGAVFLFGELATVTGRQRQLSLRRAATYGVVRRVTGNPIERLHFHERVLVPLAGKLARIVLRFNPRTTTESVQMKLLGAGLSRRLTPTTFLALKGGLAIGGFLFGLTVGTAVSASGGFLFALGFAALGFVGPDFVVSSRAKSRREAVKAQLPDALDLLAVSVEAGLGFDGAIAKITEHMEGELADECTLALGEMRIGESRQEALKRMAERVNAPELQSFVRAIIQADQLGISLGRILRVQAVDSRNRRQMAAEERAMKAPIKMLFPTVMFIFPAMFVVILGPAVLNIMETFQF
jgi:tight adherence protein C